MSESFGIAPIRDFVKGHTLEIVAVAASTLAYHFVTRKDSKTHNGEDDEMLMLEAARLSSSPAKLPAHILYSQNSLLDEVKSLYNPASSITLVPHLIQQLEFKSIPNIRSPLIGDNAYRSIYGGQGFLPEEAFVYQGSYVLYKNKFHASQELINPKKWLLAGPRKFLHFKPAQVRAAIVTCGGLCPGLNVVIREIYTALTNLYGCSEVWGIKFGYMGFYSGEQYWIRLYQKFVRELQYQGGTVFGSSRGGFGAKVDAKEKDIVFRRMMQEKGVEVLDAKQLQEKDESFVQNYRQVEEQCKSRLKEWVVERQDELVRQFGDKIIDALIKRGINQLYVLGGDGTHRGIARLASMIKEKKLEITIVGIPKTIDNDIPIIDKTFGFETAVAESIRAIRSAYVQSRGVDYGIGLVRLMGRDAGFIAMEATNASRDVDICLIPEFKFDLYGENGVFEYIYQQLKVKHHLVIVVAEGAGGGVRDLKELKSGAEKDPSGNVKLPDIGVFLKKEIVEECKKRGMAATLKYIDPAYMIRTVAANSSDRKMCAHLASSAVHGAMAGFTSFTVGHINQHVAMIPVTSLDKPKRVNKDSRTWQRVLAYTGQPFFLNE